MPDAQGNVSNADGIGLSIDGYATLKVTQANIGLQYNQGTGGYISISNGAIGMGTKGLIAIYGSNIDFDNTKFKIIGIPAAKQEGIYARFA